MPVERLAPLPAGTFYRHDLVGCAVETTAGRRVGVVEDVEGTHGGQPAGRDGDGGGEVLVPLAAEICTRSIRRRSGS